MPLFVRVAPARKLRRAYRAYRSQPRLSGPLAIGVALAVGGHVLAGAASAPAAPVTAAAPAPVTATATAAYRVSDTELRYARPAVPLKPPAAPRIAARSSRGAARPAAKPAATAVAKPRSAGRWVRPTRGPVTSPYGMRWGRMHKGLDFGAPHGAAVVATFDGVVIHAGWGLSGYGRQIRVRHAGGVVTTYSHLSAMSVSSGTRVSAGQLIGRVGSTGNVTGPHLHFEIHVGGAAVNPRPFLRSRGLTV